MAENGFKETEIGLIPEDWDVTTLSEAYEFTKKPRGFNWDSFDEIPFIPMECISDNEIYITRYETKKPTEINSGTFVKKGDLLVAKITPSFENGKQGILADIPADFAYATTEVWPIHEREGQSDINYLFCWLKVPTIRNEVAGKMEGSTGRQRVPKNVLENLNIPLPSYLEQKAIALLLYKIQNSIDLQEKIILTTKDLKKSLMNKIFTEGLRGEKLKETDIGLMPMSWEIKAIADVTEKTYQKDLTKEPNVIFKYIDVSSISNQSFKVIEYNEYSGKEAPSRARKVINSNDVIFATVRPTLKRIAIIDISLNESICSTAFCVLRSKKSFDSRFLFYCVQRDIFIDELGKLQRGASYPAVTDGDVKKQKIPVPILEEQKEIAEVLSSVDEKISKSETKRLRYTELFKSMLQLLMTGQVRVKDLDFEVANV